MRYFIKKSFLLIYLMVGFSFSVFSQDESAASLFAKAESLRKFEKNTEAIDVLNKALTLDKSNPQYFFAQGLNYVALKEYSSAITSFKEVNYLDKSHAAAYFLTAKCFKALEDQERAMAYFDLAFRYEKAVEERVNYKKELISLLISKKAYSEASKHIHEGLVVKPVDTDLSYYKAMIMNRQGRYRETIKVLEPLVANLKLDNPKKNARYFYELGLAYQKLGKWKLAEMTFEKANYGTYRTLISKMSPDYYVGLANAYSKVGQHEKAKDHLKKALSLQSDNTEARDHMGKIASVDLDYSKTVEELMTALEDVRDIDYKNEIYARLTLVHFANQKYEKALEYSLNFLVNDPDVPKILFVKAMSEYQLEDYHTAIGTLKSLEGRYHEHGSENLTKYKFLLGLSYMKIREYKHAKDTFESLKDEPFKSAASEEIKEIERRLAL